MRRKSIEEYMKNVESVLKEFPDGCSDNYINNKETLKVMFKINKNSTTKGKYNSESNEMILYDIKSAHHELFHMAFNDRAKINKKVDSKADIFHGNGISLIIGPEKFGKGLVEGFAEYLARKCGIGIGEDINCYFAELLISIHGEEILSYPLKMDPLGFYTDERFTNVFDYAKTLDILDSAFNDIVFVVNSKKICKKAIRTQDYETVNAVKDLIIEIKETVPRATKMLFEQIILEYTNCTNPRIGPTDFKKKLNAFCENPNYSVAFRLDSCVHLKESLQEIFTSLDYNKSKKQVSKIKK